MKIVWRYDSMYICCVGSLISTSDTQRVKNSDCGWIFKTLIYIDGKVTFSKIKFVLIWKLMPVGRNTGKNDKWRMSKIVGL